MCVCECGWVFKKDNRMLTHATFSLGKNNKDRERLAYGMQCCHYSNNSVDMLAVNELNNKTMCNVEIICVVVWYPMV